MRAKHDRQQNRLFLLFAVGMIVAVMLVLTRTAYITRRNATLETIETALFYIDAVVTVEAAARATRYDAALTARAVFTTREVTFATGEAAEAAYETAGATREAAYNAFAKAGDFYAVNMDSAPAAATYEAALFEKEIPAATIETAAFATLETASQDHEAAAALVTAAVTYEAQTLATIEAQEALPLWYWLLPQR